MKMKNFTLAAVIAGGSIACATASAPKELVDARMAYDRVAAGPAAQYTPTELHDAKMELDSAEKAFRSNGSTIETRDQSYLALRSIEKADVDGVTVKTQKDARRAQSEYYKVTEGELAQTRDQLDRERQARMDAEKRATDAMNNLSKFAAVREEERGTVITLSGQVLFASGKSALLPASRPGLNEVADALKERSDRHVLIEGFTDSKGSDKLNLRLSQARADAVRKYLVSRGVAESQINAEGKGKDQPVADNATVEGRANNRRVEIVIQKAQATVQAPTPVNVDNATTGTTDQSGTLQPASSPSTAPSDVGSDGSRLQPATK